MIGRGSSQVVTLAPDGTGPYWLGSLGHVAALSYGWVLPGGCDALACTLMVPPQFRHDALNPGRIVRAFRGGQCIWDGKMDEPTPSVTGWQITAHGSGQFGGDFRDVWSSGAGGGSGTWASVDNHINTAIARGLRWTNPGQDSAPSAGQYYFLQKEDSAAQDITTFLNLVCTYGGLTWYVGQPGTNSLSIFPLPTTPNRLLVATTPVARTLNGGVNRLWIRYQDSADSGTATAFFGLVSASVQASITAHGAMEGYVDLSASGTDVSGVTAAAAGTAILKRFQRINFAGPFTVQPGQLLNLGGQPVDLGMDHCGTVCKLIVTDYGYGGEVVPGMISFLVGAYAFDDATETATVTPFQSVTDDITRLVSAMFPTGKMLTSDRDDPPVRKRRRRHHKRRRHPRRDVGVG